MNLSLIKPIEELKNNLQVIQPPQSELTSVITYTLMGTALVGIMLYHYIKQQEESP